MTVPFIPSPLPQWVMTKIELRFGRWTVATIVIKRWWEYKE